MECSLSGRCGGCSLLGQPYEEQLADKSALLSRLMGAALEAAGGSDRLPPLAVLPSPPFEYRSRVELHRLPEEPPARRVKKLCSGGGAPEVRAGFMARAGAEIIPVHDCPIAVPAIRAALRSGLLIPPPGKNRWAVFAAGKELLQEGGKRRGTVRLLDKIFTVDAEVFFQSNLILLEQLITDLCAFAARFTGKGEVWDLYGGVGTFAAFLLPYFSRLRLWEADKAACVLARENLNRGYPARVDDVYVYALNDRAWAAACSKRRLPAPAFVCADPPREGLSPDAVRMLADCGTPALAYISCNPHALARDTRILLGAGYTLGVLRFYDFYPQTGHIESLAVFERASD